MKSFRLHRKNNKKRKFKVVVEFHLEAKNIKDVLNYTEKLKHATVSIKETTNETRGAGIF